jgi:hypothetical protein
VPNLPVPTPPLPSLPLPGIPGLDAEITLEVGIGF